MKVHKRALKHAPWVIILIVLYWLAFYHTDEFGMTSWEHTRDALGDDDWIGWIHPFGSEVSRTVKLGPYDSLEQCQNDAFDRLQRSYNEWRSAEYYCGYKCSSNDPRLREQNCRVIRK